MGNHSARLNRLEERIPTRGTADEKHTAEEWEAGLADCGVFVTLPRGNLTHAEMLDCLTKADLCRLVGRGRMQDAKEAGTEWEPPDHWPGEVKAELRQVMADGPPEA